MARQEITELNTRLQQALGENRRLADQVESSRKEAEKEINELRWKIAVMQEKLDQLQDEHTDIQCLRLDPEKARHMLQEFKNIIESPVAGLIVNDMELPLKITAEAQDTREPMKIMTTDRNTCSGYPDELFAHTMQAG